MFIKYFSLFWITCRIQSDYSLFVSGVSGGLLMFLTAGKMCDFMGLTVVVVGGPSGKASLMGQWPIAGRSQPKQEAYKRTCRSIFLGFLYNNYTCWALPGSPSHSLHIQRREGVGGGALPFVTCIRLPGRCALVTCSGSEMTPEKQIYKCLEASYVPFFWKCTKDRQFCFVVNTQQRGIIN